MVVAVSILDYTTWFLERSFGLRGECGIELYGTTYKTVSFSVPGNHRVTGYINEQNLLEKVETWIDGVAVEAQFHGYGDFGGVQFPTMITEKQNGELSLILIVKEVQVTR